MLMTESWSELQWQVVHTDYRFDIYDSVKKRKDRTKEKNGRYPWMGFVSLKYKAIPVTGREGP
jgi:hypothetical protein